MPRGRLPTGIVPTTFKSPPSMMVTSPDLSLETNIWYAAPAARAGAGAVAAASNASAPTALVQAAERNTTINTSPGLKPVVCQQESGAGYSTPPPGNYSRY